MRTDPADFLADGNNNVVTPRQSIVMAVLLQHGEVIDFEREEHCGCSCGWGQDPGMYYALTNDRRLAWATHAADQITKALP